jgi:hypothetical protein
LTPSSTTVGLDAYSMASMSGGKECCSQTWPSRHDADARSYADVCEGLLESDTS